MAQNMGADLLGGYLGSVGTASTGYLPTSFTSPAGRVGSSVGTLTRVVIHIAAFWIVSIAVLIALHKIGFRFSITIG